MSAAVREAIRRARESGDLSGLVEAIPYARFLGITVERDDGGLIGNLRYSDMLIGNAVLPALHGGTIAALLESTAVFQLLFTMETVAIPKTIDITFDYLRTGRAVDTFARARVEKPGRRISNVRVEAWQDDPARPVALAYGHFLLTPVDAP